MSNTITINVGTAANIVLPANASTIKSTIRQGKNLVIELTNGQVLVLEGYFENEPKLFINSNGGKEVVQLNIDADGKLVGSKTLSYTEAEALLGSENMESLAKQTSDILLFTPGETTTILSTPVLIGAATVLAVGGVVAAASGGGKGGNGGGSAAPSSQTITINNPDGSVTKKTTQPNGDYTAETTKDGKVISKETFTHNKDGSTTKIVEKDTTGNGKFDTQTTTTTHTDGSSTTEVKKDTDGDGTYEKTVSKETVTPNKDGSKTTVTETDTTGNGKPDTQTTKTENPDGSSTSETKKEADGDKANGYEKPVSKGTVTPNKDGSKTTVTETDTTGNGKPDTETTKTENPDGSSTTEVKKDTDGNSANGYEKPVSKETVTPKADGTVETKTQVDTDGDGKYDTETTKVEHPNGTVTTEVKKDKDGDGKYEAPVSKETTTPNADGSKTTVTETDTTGNGKYDTETTKTENPDGSSTTEVKKDTNGDGKYDAPVSKETTTPKADGTVVTKTETDTTGDGKYDTETTKTQNPNGTTTTEVKKDADGNKANGYEKPVSKETVTPKADGTVVTKTEADTTGNGKYDTETIKTQHPNGTTTTEVKKDTDNNTANGYEKPVSKETVTPKTNGSVETKTETDASGNGKYDTETVKTTNPDGSSTTVVKQSTQENGTYDKKVSEETVTHTPNGKQTVTKADTTGDGKYDTQTTTLVKADGTTVTEVVKDKNGDETFDDKDVVLSKVTVTPTYEGDKLVKEVRVTEEPAKGTRKVETSTFDDQGRVVKKESDLDGNDKTGTNGAETVEYYEYNPDGSVTKFANTDGKATGGNSADGSKQGIDQITKTIYDEQGRVKEELVDNDRDSLANPADRTKYDVRKEFTYDDKGRKTSESTDKTNDGTIDEKVTYEYDDVNNIRYTKVDTNVKDGLNKVDFVMKDQLDAQGRVVVRERDKGADGVFDSREEYYYEANKNNYEYLVISTKNSDGTQHQFTAKSERDDFGRNRVEYWADGVNKDEFSADKVTTTHKSEYSPSGLTLHRQTISSDNPDQVAMSYVYHHNIYGQAVGSDVNWDGKGENELYVRREYDAYGNILNIWNNLDPKNPQPTGGNYTNLSDPTQDQLNGVDLIRRRKYDKFGNTIYDETVWVKPDGEEKVASRSYKIFEDGKHVKSLINRDGLDTGVTIDGKDGIDTIRIDKYDKFGNIVERHTDWNAKDPDLNRIRYYKYDEATGKLLEKEFANHDGKDSTGSTVEGKAGIDRVTNYQYTDGKLSYKGVDNNADGIDDVIEYTVYKDNGLTKRTLTDRDGANSKVPYNNAPQGQTVEGKTDISSYTDEKFDSQGRLIEVSKNSDAQGEYESRVFIQYSNNDFTKTTLTNADGKEGAGVTGKEIDGHKGIDTKVVEKFTVIQAKSLKDSDFDKAEIVVATKERTTTTYTANGDVASEYVETFNPASGYAVKAVKTTYENGKTVKEYYEFDAYKGMQVLYLKDNGDNTAKTYTSKDSNVTYQNIDKVIKTSYDTNDISHQLQVAKIVEDSNNDGQDDIITTYERNQWGQITKLVEQTKGQGHTVEGVENVTKFEFYEYAEHFTDKLVGLKANLAVQAGDTFNTFTKVNYNVLDTNGYVLKAYQNDNARADTGKVAVAADNVPASYGKFQKVLEATYDNNGRRVDLSNEDLVANTKFKEYYHLNAWGQIEFVSVDNKNMDGTIDEFHVGWNGRFNTNGVGYRVDLTDSSVWTEAKLNSMLGTSLQKIQLEHRNIPDAMKDDILILNKDVVAKIADDTKTLLIEGNQGDTVHLGGFTKATAQDKAGYLKYTADNSHTVYVESVLGEDHVILS